MQHSCNQGEFRATSSLLRVGESKLARARSLQSRALTFDCVLHMFCCAVSVFGFFVSLSFCFPFTCFANDLGLASSMFRIWRQEDGAG